MTDSRLEGLDEAELVRRCQHGDAEACAELDRRGVEPPLLEPDPPPIEDAEAGDEADEDDYVGWVMGETLTALQLRGAQHAAERAGEHDDARKLAAEIADREALEGAR